jgi:LPS export ABC transporter protein LptC
MIKYFLMFLVIVSLFSGCRSEKVKPLIDASMENTVLPAQESWNSTIIFTDSGNTKAILNTGHLRVYEHDQITLLDSSLTVDFYDDKEIKTTTLTSDRGKVNDATRDLYAIDNVVVVNDSGVTIKTEELMWRNSDQKIVSDKFVTITSPQEIIQGYGFESDQALRNYVIYRITYVTRNDTAK